MGALEPEVRFNAPDAAGLRRPAGLLRRGGSVVLQFASPPYREPILRAIDELCSEHGHRVRVRFYGHYGREFDFEALTALPNVQTLSTDCLQRARNVEVPRELRKLRRLSFGVFECP